MRSLEGDSEELSHEEKGRSGEGVGAAWSLPGNCCARLEERGNLRYTVTDVVP